MKPYSTTSQVLNQTIATLAKNSGWNVSEPGTLTIQDITYTALSTGGAAPISVSYIPGGTAGHEVVTVSGSAIVVQIQSGVSTATQVQTAIAASPSAAALVYAAISGTAGTAQVALTAPVVITGDVCQRIAEADNEIDTRLAGMGVNLPFVVNPPILQDFSVLYARYACLRDLYTGNNPLANSESAKLFLQEFDAKWTQMQTGWKVLVDGTSTPISAGKFTPQSVGYPQTEQGGDLYPNYPNGPYPDIDEC